MTTECKSRSIYPIPLILPRTLRRTVAKQHSRFIQIDDPNLTFFCDEAFTEEQAKEGVDLDALLDPHIKSHNDVLKDLPADLKIGVHLCRGKAWQLAISLRQRS